MAKELILAMEEEVDRALVTGTLTFSDKRWWLTIVEVIIDDVVTHRDIRASEFEEQGRNNLSSSMSDAKSLAHSTLYLITKNVNNATRHARAEGRIEAEMGAK